MTWGSREHQHPEPDITLGPPEVESPAKWQFPGPLPSPLPLDMAAEIIADEFLSIREYLDDAARLIGSRLEAIEQTLRDTTGGRAG